MVEVSLKDLPTIRGERAKLEERLRSMEPSVRADAMSRLGCITRVEHIIQAHKNHYNGFCRDKTYPTLDRLLGDAP